MKPATHLRESYQLPIYNDIPRQLAAHGACLVQSPTGSGKSVIMEHTVARILNAGRTPLVLSHRTKIHNQLVKHCNGMPIASNVKDLYIAPARCYVAMIQTLAKRPRILSQFSKLGRSLVIIVDECHIGTSKKLLDQLPDAYRIGFSATPSYKSAPHLPTYYKTLIHGPQPSQLIQEGYLSHYRHEMMTGADLDDLEKVHGEYTEASQERVFGTAKLYAGLETTLSDAKFRKCLIFCASIKAAEQLCAELVEKGFSAVCYHSQKQSGDYELAKFTTLHQANIVVSVGALSEGFDYPPIDCVVLYRKTTSLPLYIQMIGRGGRPLPGKHGFTVLDFGENAATFGPWSADRDWHALWQPPPKRKTRANDGLTPSKECPQCFCLVTATARSCFNCGYIWPVKEVELAEGQLRTVIDTMQEMTGKRLSELTPEELALYANQEQRKPLAARVARSREQIEPGFLTAFASAMKYKRGWVDRQELPEERIPYSDLVVKFSTQL